MKRIFIILFLLSFTARLAAAGNTMITNRVLYRESDRQTGEVEEYLKKRREEKAAFEKKARAESPLRRFEVMFFSSGAMTYWSSLIFVKLFAQIATGHSSVMNNTYWYYIGFNALGIATYVAVKDYYDRRDEAVFNQNKYGNLNQKNYTINLLYARF